MSSTSFTLDTVTEQPLRGAPQNHPTRIGSYAGEHHFYPSYSVATAARYRLQTEETLPLQHDTYHKIASARAFGRYSPDLTRPLSSHLKTTTMASYPTKSVASTSAAAGYTKEKPAQPSAVYQAASQMASPISQRFEAAKTWREVLKEEQAAIAQLHAPVAAQRSAEAALSSGRHIILNRTEEKALRAQYYETNKSMLALLEQEHDRFLKLDAQHKKTLRDSTLEKEALMHEVRLLEEKVKTEGQSAHRHLQDKQDQIAQLHDKIAQMKRKLETEMADWTKANETLQGQINTLQDLVVQNEQVESKTREDMDAIAHDRQVLEERLALRETELKRAAKIIQEKHQSALQERDSRLQSEVDMVKLQTLLKQRTDTLLAIKEQLLRKGQEQQEAHLQQQRAALALQKELEAVTSRYQKAQQENTEYHEREREWQVWLEEANRARQKVMKESQSLDERSRNALQEVDALKLKEQGLIREVAELTHQVKHWMQKTAEEQENLSKTQSRETKLGHQLEMAQTEAATLRQRMGDTDRRLADTERDLHTEARRTKELTHAVDLNQTKLMKTEEALVHLQEKSRKQEEDNNEARLKLSQLEQERDGLRQHLKEEHLAKERELAFRTAAQDRVKSQEEMIAKGHAELQRLRTELEKCQRSLHNAQTQVKVAQQQEAKWKEDVAHRQETIDALQTDVQTLTKQVGEVRTQRQAESAEHEQQQRIAQSRHDALEADHDRLQRLLQEVQRRAEEDRQQHVDYERHARTTLAALEDTKQNHETQLSQLQSTLKTVNDTLRDAQVAVAARDEEIRGLHANVREKEQQVQRLVSDQEHMMTEHRSALHQSQDKFLHMTDKVERELTDLRERYEETVAALQKSQNQNNLLTNQLEAVQHDRDRAEQTLAERSSSESMLSKQLSQLQTTVQEQDQEISLLGFKYQTAAEQRSRLETELANVRNTIFHRDHDVGKVASGVSNVARRLREQLLSSGEHPPLSPVTSRSGVTLTATTSASRPATALALQRPTSPLRSLSPSRYIRGGSEGPSLSTIGSLTSPSSPSKERLYVFTNSATPRDGLYGGLTAREREYAQKTAEAIAREKPATALQTSS